jgi:hypothetical protein
MEPATPRWVDAAAGGDPRELRAGRLVGLLPPAAELDAATRAELLQGLQRKGSAAGRGPVLVLGVAALGAAAVVVATAALVPGGGSRPRPALEPRHEPAGVHAVLPGSDPRPVLEPVRERRVGGRDGGTVEAHAGQRVEIAVGPAVQRQVEVFAGQAQGASTERADVVSVMAPRPRAVRGQITRRPTVTPASPAPAAAPAERSSLGDEAERLAHVLGELRQGRASEALRWLDRYEHDYPEGTLHFEARLARIDAVLSLGRRDQALTVLERLQLRDRPREQELRVLRGELLAERGRCSAAQTDLDRVSELGGDRPGPLMQRAHRARTACSARRAPDAGQ